MIVEIQKFCYHGNVTSHFSSLFPTSKNSLLQNEAKCKPFLVKMSFICIRIKNQFHINGFALSSAFKLRLGALRKMVCPYFMSQKQRAVKRRKTKKVWSKLVKSLQCISKKTIQVYTNLEVKGECLEQLPYVVFLHCKMSAVCSIQVMSLIKDCL